MPAEKASLGVPFVPTIEVAARASRTNSELYQASIGADEAEPREGTSAQVFEPSVERNHNQSTGTIQSKRSVWKQFTYWFEEIAEGQWLTELGPYFAVNYGDWLRNTDEPSQKPLSINANLYRVKSVIGFAKLRVFVSWDIPREWDFPDVDREDEISGLLFTMSAVR